MHVSGCGLCMSCVYMKSLAKAFVCCVLHAFGVEPVPLVNCTGQWLELTYVLTYLTLVIH